MLTPFFGSAKPINFAIVVGFMVLVFLATHGLHWQEVDNPPVFLAFCALLIYIFGAVILDFTVKKNNITKKNSYNILVFACLTGAFCSGLLNYRALLALLFVLLAFRRIITMRSGLTIVKKIFDASLWISVACVLQPLCILYFLVLYYGIIYYGRGNYRDWLLPFMGMFTVAIIIAALMSLSVMDFPWSLEVFELRPFDFTLFFKWQTLLAVVVVFLTTVLALPKYFMLVKERVARMERPSYLLIVLAAGVGLAIFILSPKNDMGNIFFALAPLSIVMARFLQATKKLWITETYLWALVLLPVVNLVFFSR